MPSASNIFNEIKGVNARLDGVNGKLDPPGDRGRRARAISAPLRSRPSATP